LGAGGYFQNQQFSWLVSVPMLKVSKQPIFAKTVTTNLNLGTGKTSKSVVGEASGTGKTINGFPPSHKN
jgi:sortase (surface protein transpeptidase)